MDRLLNVVESTQATVRDLLKSMQLMQKLMDIHQKEINALKILNTGDN